MRKVALLIGVDHYEDPAIVPLRYAAADVRDVAEELSSRCEFDQVTVLADADGPRSATKSRVLGALKAIAGELRPDDLFLFGFSGHGIESGGNAFLLTSDSQHAFLEETGLGLALLRKNFGFITASRRALILDCCRNDPDAGRGNADNVMSDAMSRDILAVARTAGATGSLPPTTIVLSACSPGQRAYEFPTHGHGVFTHYLLDGLRGKAWSGDTLTLADLGAYTAKEVAHWSSATPGLKAPQTPWLEQVGFPAALLLAHRGRGPAFTPVPSKTTLAMDIAQYEGLASKGTDTSAWVRERGLSRREAWRAAGEAGEATAQHLMGRYHDVLAENAAIGVDATEAVRWYRMAADQGYANSQNNLGFCYEWGAGVEKHASQAARWYRAAAQQGFPWAMQNLARCCRDGIGMPVDNPQAEEWFERAAKAGAPQSPGLLLALRLRLAFESFSAPDAQTATKDRAAIRIGSLIAELATLDSVAVCEVMASPGTQRMPLNEWDADGTPNETTAPGPTATGDRDRLTKLRRNMAQTLADVYANADPGTKLQYIDLFAQETLELVSDWFCQTDYDQIASFALKSFDKLQMGTLRGGNRCHLVRLLNLCIRGMLEAGYRGEAHNALNQCLAMYDGISVDEPWDWYLKMAWADFCFQIAKCFSVLGDLPVAQPLLRRAYTIKFSQYGRARLLSRFTDLPLRGKAPVGATADDAKAFTEFKMKRLTIPVEFGAQKAPMHIWLLAGPRGYAELQDQFRTIKEKFGGMMPAEVKDSFRKLNGIAVETNVDFLELCIHALGVAKDSSTNSKK